jgi:hypothetical protein
MLDDKIIRVKKTRCPDQVLNPLNLPKVPIYLLFPQKQMPNGIPPFFQEIHNANSEAESRTLR